jgi:hypothetical protein
VDDTAVLESWEVFVCPLTAVEPGKLRGESAILLVASRGASVKAMALLQFE